MQIFVRSVEKTFVVSLDEAAQVSDLKTEIENIEFIPGGEFE